MKVIKIQALATVQDLGRPHFRSSGIGTCGAMDALALQAGNLLLKNDENAAAIEIALGCLVVQFEQEVSFCITGAQYQADLDGEPVYSYWRYTARKGQILRLNRALYGMYGYLCVQGGIDVPLVLGSRSTDLNAHFGGYQGRALQEGDELPLQSPQAPLSSIGILPIPLTNVIHALPSSEFSAFTQAAQQQWWQGEWTLQSNSNRMGYRFLGEPLTLQKPLEMLSHAVQFGTIQVPPSGWPIILMADAQTTGGYPKIASVAQADLGRLAQVRLGSPIKFKAINALQAVSLRQKNANYLYQIRRIAYENR